MESKTTQLKDFFNNFSGKFYGKRIGNFVTLFLTICLTLAMSSSGWGQTVTTDKNDYAPGEIAVISGSGWIGDSMIDIYIDEDPALNVDYQHDFYDVIVDADGNWSVNFQIEEYHLGVTFYVTVKGQQTGRTAETVFTDGTFAFNASGLEDNVSLYVSYSGGFDFGRSFTTPNTSNTDAAVNQNISFYFTPNIITLNQVKFTILNYNVTFNSSKNTSQQISNVFNSGPTNAANAKTITANYGVLISNNSSATYAGSVNLVSTFYSNYQSNAKISNKTITFYLDGTAVGSAVTNASGVATLNLNLANVPTLGKLDADDYTITTSFGGDSGLLAVFTSV